MPNKSKDKDKNVCKLPEKVFSPKDSLLTHLFKNKDFKAIYHICVSTFITLFLNSAVNDYLTGKKIRLGFHYFVEGFSNPLVGFYIWIFMFLFALLCYILFYIWGKIRTNFNPKQNIFYYDRISIFCVIIYYSAFIIIPTYLIRQTNQPVASSLALLLEQVRFLMKIHAYIRSNVPIIINFKPKTEDFTFPNFNNYFYFLFAPTLVYRDEYPREKKRNWKNIITLTVEFVLTLFYLAFVMERFFLTPFQDWCLKERKWSDLFSQIMINMIPALLVKLCGFFMFLHIWLNLFAEILRFGDREFYKDWWNSNTFALYYKTWNTVVHDWLYTYIYKDMYEYVVPRSRHFARFMVFFTSAIFHEYILCFALKIFLPVMFLQFFIFGTIFSLIHQFNFIGNIFLWFSLQLGISVQISLYSVESYSRMNCPYENSSLINYFVPRFLNCDCI